MSFQSYIDKMVPAMASKNSMEQQRILMEQLMAIQQLLRELVDSAKEENKQYLQQKVDEILESIHKQDVESVNEKIDRLNDEVRSLYTRTGERTRKVERVSFLDVKPTNIANIRYLVRLLKQAQEQEATPEAAESTNNLTERVERAVGAERSEPLRPSVTFNPTSLKAPLEGVRTPQIAKEYGNVAASPFADYQILIKGFYDTIRDLTPNFVKRFFTKERTLRLPSFGRRTSSSDSAEETTETTEARPEQNNLQQAALDDVIRELERLLDELEESDNQLIQKVEELLNTVKNSDEDNDDMVENLAIEVSEIKLLLSENKQYSQNGAEARFQSIENNLKLLAPGSLPTRTEFYNKVAKSGFDVETGVYNLPEDSYRIIEAVNDTMSSGSLALPEYKEDDPEQPLSESLKINPVVEALAEEDKVGDPEQPISESLKINPVVEALAEEDKEDDDVQEEQHKEVIEELKKAKSAQFKITDLLTSPTLLLGGLGAVLASSLFSEKGREFFGALVDKLLDGISGIMQSVFDSALGWIAKQFNLDYDSRDLKGDSDHLLNQAKAAAAAGKRVQAPNLYSLDTSNKVSFNEEGMSEVSKRLSNSLTYWDKLDSVDTLIGAASGAAAGAGVGALVGSAVPIIGTGIGAGVGALAGGLAGWLYSDTRATDKIIEQYKKQGFSQEEAEANVETLVELAKGVDEAARRQITYFRNGNKSMDVVEGNVTLPAQFVKSVLRANGFMDENGNLTEEFNNIDDETLRKILVYSVGAKNVAFGVKGNSVRITATGDLPAVNYKAAKSTFKYTPASLYQDSMGRVRTLPAKFEEVKSAPEVQGFSDEVKGSYVADVVSQSYKKEEAVYEEKVRNELLNIAPHSRGTGSRLFETGSSLDQGLSSDGLQAYSIEEDKFKRVSGEAALSDNFRYLRGLLRSKGYSESAIAGILSNLYSESSFNPKADNGVGYGIAQWAGDRRKNLMKAYPDTYSTLEAQGAYLLTELNQMGFTPAAMNSLSPQEAALKVAGGYEATNQGYSRSIASYLQSRSKKGGKKDASGNIIWSDPGWYWANPEVRSKNAVWFYDRATEDMNESPTIGQLSQTHTQPNASPAQQLMSEVASVKTQKPVNQNSETKELAQNVNNSNVVVNNYYTSSNGLNIGNYS